MQKMLHAFALKFISQLPDSRFEVENFQAPDRSQPQFDGHGLLYISSSLSEQVVHQRRLD